MYLQEEITTAHHCGDTARAVPSRKFGVWWAGAPTDATVGSRRDWERQDLSPVPSPPCRYPERRCEGALPLPAAVSSKASFSA